MFVPPLLPKLVWDQILLHRDFAVPFGEDYYRKVLENISVDSDVLLQDKKETNRKNKKRNSDAIANHL